MEPFAAVVLSEGQATHTAGVPSIRYVPMAHCTHTPLEDSSYPGLQSSAEFNSKCAISRLAAYIQHQHKVDLLKKRIFHTEILPLFHKKKITFKLTNITKSHNQMQFTVQVVISVLKENAWLAYIEEILIMMITINYR